MSSSQTTFLMLGALFVLFGWVVVSVVRRAYRKRRSIFGDRPVLRYFICSALLLAACFELYHCTRAISSGHILVALGGGFHTSSHAHTIYRANNPSGFWAAICSYYYLSIVFLYVFFGEVLVFVRQKNVKPKSSA